MHDHSNQRSWSRRPVFPLPKELEREVTLLVEQLERRHVGERSCRAFCRDMMRGLYEVTGRIYGHSTYRKMLALYAPTRRPSSDTLQGEIRSLRSETATAVSKEDRSTVPRANPVSDSHSETGTQRRFDLLNDLIQDMAASTVRLCSLAAGLADIDGCAHTEVQLALKLVKRVAELESALAREHRMVKRLKRRNRLLTKSLRLAAKTAQIR